MSVWLILWVFIPISWTSTAFGCTKFPESHWYPVWIISIDEFEYRRELRIVRVRRWARLWGRERLAFDKHWARAAACAALCAVRSSHRAECSTRCTRREPVGVGVVQLAPLEPRRRERLGRQLWRWSYGGFQRSARVPSAALPLAQATAPPQVRAAVRRALLSGYATARSAFQLLYSSKI